MWRLKSCSRNTPNNEECEFNLKLDSGGVLNNGLELEIEDKWLEVCIFALDFNMVT